MTVHRLIGSPLAAIIFLVTAGTVSAQTQKELLDELDRTIEEAESYVSAKELRIKTIENTLHSRGVSPERQYRIYGELFDEYHYQNFYEFPKFRIKLLILILLHFNIVRIIY